MGQVAPQRDRPLVVRRGGLNRAASAADWRCKGRNSGRVVRRSPTYPMKRGAPMASLQIYDPFAEAGFDDLFRGFFRPVRATERSAPAAIKVDVTENEKGYVVHAEIPGVSKDQIQVAVEGNQVTIAAEVKRNNETKDGERLLRT